MPKDIFEESKIARGNAALNYCAAVSRKDGVFSDAFITKDPNGFFAQLEADKKLDPAQRVIWINKLFDKCFSRLSKHNQGKIREALLSADDFEMIAQVSEQDVSAMARIGVNANSSNSSGTNNNNNNNNTVNMPNNQ